MHNCRRGIRRVYAIYLIPVQAADGGVGRVHLGFPGEGDVLGCQRLPIRPFQTVFEVPGDGQTVGRNPAVRGGGDFLGQVGDLIVLVIPFAEASHDNLIEPYRIGHVAILANDVVGLL